MPVFFQQDIDHSTRLAIWKIEESPIFFSDVIGLQRAVSHPHKNLQHLSGRYLLKLLFPEFPLSLIQIADTRKPYLEDEKFHFSISHCGDYAAAIVSTTKRVGVDIEVSSQKVERISHKFISAEEEILCGGLLSADSLSLIKTVTLMWSCKEAVFKWYGYGGVDFKKHIQLKSVNALSQNSFNSKIIFKRNEDQHLDLHSVFFNDLCLSYVVT
ncbi:MAG: 4'-phosphopantetheinyl transferase family protein [Chitinophagaceae bacterium]